MDDSVVTRRANTRAARTMNVDLLDRQNHRVKTSKRHRIPVHFTLQSINNRKAPLVRTTLGSALLTLLLLFTLVLSLPNNQVEISRARVSQQSTPGSLGQAFDEAAHEFGVPSTLLEAICYMEGRLSDQDGSPSIDNGFGCMHLVKNRHGDTLDQAARELKVSVDQLKFDLPINIRGGAAILRDNALQLSKTLPTSLGGWYGAVAAYSNSITRSTALMYANNVYKILRQGFSAPTDSGEEITLKPQAVQPNIVSAAGVQGKRKGALPAGCTLDNKVDYAGAVDCILPPQNFDCNVTPKDASCSYESGQRPEDFAINQIVIHDIEGTAPSALNVFQDPNATASAHYIVDSDGTIYQMLHETDIAYHAGNYWYNQHSIGIEHAGFDATGYRWYNATEYLASAKLVAYLLQKYKLPLDRAHVVAHGTIPSPSSTSTPNHVDPGPYWLWDYYFGLIHTQGVAFPNAATTPKIITLKPKSDQRLLGSQGKETSANFTFFYLYTGPSTHSARIPRQGRSADITDVTDSVEPDTSYYYVAKVQDSAGSGDTMYQIWYGVEDHAHAAKQDLFAHASLAWLAAPRGAAVEGQGTPVTLTTSDNSKPLIYGRPTTGKTSIIGDAPTGAIFVSAYTVTEDGTSNQWYEINYNHRQGWIPATEVTLAQTKQPVQQPVPPTPTP